MRGGREHESRYHFFTNVMSRERKVPWVPLAVMASKVLLVFLVQLVLKVRPERMEIR